MSDYTQITDFSAKDLLASGDPNKLIKGSDVDAELDAIVTAIATKYDGSDLASQAEAEAGASSSVLMTPLRTEQWGVAWADENAGMVGDIHGLADPGADRLLFWDDSVGAVGPLTVSTGLTLSGTNLSVDIGNTVQGYDVNTAKLDQAANFIAGLQSSGITVATLGTNTFEETQYISASAAPSYSIINGQTGQDAGIILRENNINALFVWNDASTSTSKITKYDSTPSVVSNIIFNESGDVNFSIGTLQYGGVEVATLGANNFTDVQRIQSSFPNIILEESDAGVDNGHWRVAVNAEEFRFDLLNDAESALTTFLRVQRTGMTVDTVNFSEGELQYGGVEVVSASNTLTLTNKTLTSPVLNTGVSGTAILDEDDMTSDSATQLATQQSIKAYVDNKVANTRGALVYNTASQIIPNNAATKLVFNTESYDTDNIHDNITNNTRLTVPAGITKVRLTGLLSWSSGFNGDTYVLIWKNGSSGVYPGRAGNRYAATTGSPSTLPVVSPIIEVTPGDYFELVAFQNSGGTPSTSNLVTSFAMELIA